MGHFWRRVGRGTGTNRLNEPLLFYSLLYNFMCSSSENCSAKLNVKPPPYLRFIYAYKKRSEVRIICGDRSIMIQAATGEQGPQGPFPFITLTEKKEERGELLEGFCIHSEDRFNELWDKLKELVTK